MMMLLKIPCKIINWADRKWKKVDYKTTIQFCIKYNVSPILQSNKNMCN